MFATCSHLGLGECQLLGKALKESRDVMEMDYQIFFQQFLKWLKTCSKCWQICWLRRKADVLSNLGQRGKDAERWSAGTAVTVWLVSVTLVSWWLQERKQDLVQDDDGEDEDDTSDLRHKGCHNQNFKENYICSVLLIQTKTKLWRFLCPWSSHTSRKVDWSLFSSRDALSLFLALSLSFSLSMRSTPTTFTIGR